MKVKRKEDTMIKQMVGRKAVFFDIDGTLYDRMKNGLVPDSAREAIYKIQAAGNLAVVCTGRCAVAVEPYLRELGFDGYIYGCGTNIVFEEQELYYNEMPIETAKYLHELCREYHTLPVMEGKDNLFMDEADSAEDNGESYKFYNAFFANQILPFSGSEIKVSKAMARFFRREELLAREFKKELLALQMQVFDHSMGFEIVPQGHSKATGIEYLIDALGIAREDTYAFGDSQNDMDMLDYVQYGIAVGNAMPDVLAACEYRTAPIYEDGIYQACERFHLF